MFEKVIGRNGFLAQSKATRILVTHQVHLIQDADHIVVMDHGRVLTQGSYDDLVRNGAVDLITKQSSGEAGELNEDDITDLVDMRAIGRLRSASIISSTSINSQKTVRIF